MRPSIKVWNVTARTFNEPSVISTSDTAMSPSATIDWTLNSQIPSAGLCLVQSNEIRSPCEILFGLGRVILIISSEPFACILEIIRTHRVPKTSDHLLCVVCRHKCSFFNSPTHRPSVHQPPKLAKPSPRYPSPSDPHPHTSHRVPPDQ